MMKEKQNIFFYLLLYMKQVLFLFCYFDWLIDYRLFLHMPCYWHLKYYCVTSCCSFIIQGVNLRIFPFIMKDLQFIENHAKKTHKQKIQVYTSRWINFYVCFLRK